MEGESGKKRPLDLDFDQLIDKDDFDPPEVVRVKKPAMAVEPKKELSNQRDVALWKMKDKDIDEEIERQIRTVKNIGPKMPDKGERLRLRLKKFQDEKERRRLRGPQRELEKSTQATSSRGDFNSFNEEAPPPSVEPQSSFATIFNQKIDNDTDCRTDNAFVKEFSTMGRCNGQNTKNIGDFSQREREKGHSSSGHLPSLNPHNFYRNTNKSFLSNGDRKRNTKKSFLSNGDRKSNTKKSFLSNGDHKTRSSSTHCNTDKSFLSNGDRKTTASSTYSDRHIGENLCRSFSQKEDHYQLRNRTKKSQTIVLVDDEDPEFLDVTEQTEEFPESMKDLMICYPTRDDPQSVDICYADTKCLDPQSYLTSSIMNFYIRYLHQACPTAISDYHIFNTYFYNKLKDAVSEKRDKDDLFVKLRRWWKGVDIFQKAYILIPVNEELHWSLAIICIPDKEEESGPIILHLDSLGLHCSKSIFRNIKSFLIEEWCYLDQKSGLSDPPLSDCWKQFPDDIVERRLSVPQQKNDFDCGLFVLFFMERFIEDVPLRLKKTDLTMFGRQWFKPTEASRLRTKIRKLLKEEFQKAQDCTKSSSPTDTSEE